MGGRLPQRGRFHHVGHGGFLTNAEDFSQSRRTFNSGGDFLMHYINPPLGGFSMGRHFNVTPAGVPPSVSDSTGGFLHQGIGVSTSRNICLSSPAKRRPRKVRRRSEEELIEHTQHSRPCRSRRNRDESYHSPAVVPWPGPSGRLFAVLQAHTGVILIQIIYIPTVV